MNKKRIYFYGSLPKEGETPYGGGEIGNVRTIRMLESFGYRITPIRKLRTPSSYSLFRRNISYPFRLLEGWVKTFLLLLGSSRNNLFHLSGFAGVTILNEYILVLLVKSLGFKLLYELRGGGADLFYSNGSVLYRYLFKSILKHVDYIFSQGLEIIPFLKEFTNVPIYYYPNCVEDGFAPKGWREKSIDSLNIIFYGRLEESKHIDLIIETTAELQKEYNNVFLTIIGNGERQYVDFLKMKMTKVLNKNSYILREGCNHNLLKDFLKDKHFLIFPSTQIREGQSNSVTECMSYGIVPVASPQGFNRSTIGDNFLIVDNLDASEYANRIKFIVDNDLYQVYSKQVYSRFVNTYSQKKVFENIQQVYSNIF